MGLTRRRWSSLPLELSKTALVEQRPEGDLYRFRLRLGRGRPMRQLNVSLRYHPDEGEPVVLEVQRHEVQVWLGPRTLFARDPHRRCRAPGRFELRVEVWSAGVRWSASATWRREALRSGRFASGFVIEGGRLRWRPACWDERVV